MTDRANDPTSDPDLAPDPDPGAELPVGVDLWLALTPPDRAFAQFSPDVPFWQSLRLPSGALLLPFQRLSVRQSREATEASRRES